MAGTEQYTVKQFLKAIKGSGGIISNIADIIRTDWHTANRYIEKYPELQQALTAEKETILDIAEDKLKGRVKNDDWEAVKYVLSRKGKHRGYTERVESELNVKELPDVNINFINGNKS